MSGQRESGWSTNPMELPKGPTYYSNPREDLLRFIGSSSQHVLDVGCGAGSMGLRLKELIPDIEVVGIELDHVAAENAKSVLAKVIIGDVEELSLPDEGYGDGYFDCIVYGDILEHLKDPWAVLQRHRRCLSENGMIIASIPNVRNLRVIADLVMEGTWTYASKGILDATHLRFFTLKTAQNMVEHAGYRVVTVVPLKDNAISLSGAVSPGAATVPIRLGNLSIAAFPVAELDELNAEQFIIVASTVSRYHAQMQEAYSSRPPVPPAHAGRAGQSSGDTADAPRFSVIVVTYNSEATILGCLERVLECSPENPEIIVVDNASRDHTADVVLSLAGSHPNIALLQNYANLGFSRGVNVGLERSRGEYVVLLNPDVTVTPGWLTRLQQHLLNDQSIGAVGPTSDYVAGSQKVGLYLPASVLMHARLSAFEIADVLYKTNRGLSAETRLVIGFCLMIRRSTFQSIGGLDEELFLGNDDLDLCWRLRLAGYKLVVATDTFVHHEGQASFRTEPVTKTNALVQMSTDALRRKLERHYGPADAPSPQELWGIDWFRPTDQMTSIILITLNQLDYTKTCVNSILECTPQPFELVFVDNGSTDGTVEYLDTLSKQLENVTIIKNGSNLGFGQAANIGISRATGKHVVLLNNDTVVGRGWLLRLLRIAEQDESIGMVGPLTNYASGRQVLQTVPYTVDGLKLDGFDEYSWNVGMENAGRYFDVHRLVGFCMLIKAEVIKRIGGFDPRFSIGNFEDDDFCLRAQLAGFKAVVATDVFIHHFGSKTFVGEHFDYYGLMHENWERFKHKWGIPHERRLEEGYSAQDLLSRRVFDPRSDAVPVGENAERSLLDEEASSERGYLLTCPDWDNDQEWKEPLAWWVRRRTGDDQENTGLLLIHPNPDDGTINATMERIANYISDDLQLDLLDLPPIALSPFETIEEACLTGVVLLGSRDESRLVRFARTHSLPLYVA